MSTLQVANLHFESTGNNRLQYTGSNAYNLVAGGATVATVNTTAINFPLTITLNNSDTTLTRAAAGVLAVEGNQVPSPASQAHGDILYRGSSSWERLAAGTAGQVLTTQGAGAAPAWESTSSMTLLGTLSTTSGTNPVLSGLTLTSYKQLSLVFQAVSHNGAASRKLLIGTSTADDIALDSPEALSSEFWLGIININLTNGYTGGSLVASTSSTNILIGDRAVNGHLPITTASTAVSLALNGTGSFDGGSVLVYGVR